MFKVPISMRLAALSSYLSKWDSINEKAHRVSNSHGVSRLLQLPGLASGLLWVMSGERNTLSHLLSEGWTRAGWSKILSKWLDDQVISADPALTLPLVLTENERVTSTIYRGIGICICRSTLRNSVVDVLVSPSDESLNWVSSLMEKKGGGIIRLLPPEIQNQDSSDRYNVTSTREEGGLSWDLEHHPWPEDREVWIEGPWSPTRGELALALFPRPSRGGELEGRSILLLGPPGVGKTETAVRACLHAHNKSSRVLVVHGSVFARGQGGMTGRDAVSLVRAFKACALIVDDMPPSATVALLEEFEALHREKVAVAVTLMTDGSLPRLPGLRPGRIDEIFEFRAPDSGGRFALLRAIGGENPHWEAISKDERSEGMTPAYLREIAYRVMSGTDPGKTLSSLASQRKIAT